MPRTKKLTDYTYSPTNPASEDAIRSQIDDAIQEVYDDSARSAGTVNTTGDQTIADIKTFTSSPIVPTPTTATQASNKAYVDGVAISATIPLDSLTDGYLASAPGNIKPRVASLETDVVANTKGTSDYFITTGTQPNYVVTTGESYVSLPDGFKITIKPHADSVGTVTLNVDGIGAINCVTQEGETVVLKTGIPQTLRYNGVNFTIPSSSGLGSFFGDGSDGTIPNLNAVTTAPNGGTVANLWDMNVGTVFTTGTLSSASDQVVFSIDFGSPQFLNPSGGNYSTRLYNASLSTGVARTIAMQYSDDNVNWLDASTNSLTTTPSTIVLYGHTNSHRYYRVILKAGGSNCTVSTRTCFLNYATTSAESETALAWRILEPSTLNGGAVVKQYTDFNLPAGYEITVQNPNQGLIIYSQNDITNAGVIDMSQKAGLAPNGNAIPMLISKKAYKTAKTSSLLHFDNNITDDNGRTWTNNGGATFDATNKKFGTHAISFNGTNQWIDTPASDDFSFGSDDFTIDFWMRPTNIGTVQIPVSLHNPNTNYRPFIFQLNANGTLSFSVKNSSGLNNYINNSSKVLVNNTYYHIAGAKQNGYIKLFIDGVLMGNADASFPLGKSEYKLAIGRDGENASNYFAGQIDEFRIVKGKAMYTANFTPPTSAYTYQATFIDEPKTLEKYFQLTNVLQTLRGGYGGNGGYGGGYSGSTGRQTSVGIGGAGRQNLGGFGGGGSGGSLFEASSQRLGMVGGSIDSAELGGGKSFSQTHVTNGTASVISLGIAYCGAGGRGASYSSVTGARTVFSGGNNLGAGGGGSGAMYDANNAVGSDGQYAGGLLMLISSGNIINSGTIRANSGAGGNGSTGIGTNTGGGGGGGGAGGGVIALFHGNAYSNTGTVQVNGGTGGTGGAGAGTGEAGGVGTSGSVGTIHTQKL